MAIDPQDDILQDFLVEAGEILERLNEELVDLEQRPGDLDLLNSVFRGFHTVKGGAGFLGLTALVDVCHCAEDVFNLLRQGERQVDAPLMDAVLRALDVVNLMFGELQQGQEPQPADQALLEELQRLADPQQAAKLHQDAPAPGNIASGNTDESGASQVDAMKGETPNGDTPIGDAPLGEVTDDEFEAMLEAVQDTEQAKRDSAAGTSTGTPPGDEITDEEFDALLDQLHGAGKHGGVPSPGSSQVKPDTFGESKPQDSKPADGEITEDEFEALLDALHGQGKAPGVGEAVKNDDIDEQEFEALLDQLHGSGKAPGARNSNRKKETAGTAPPVKTPASAPGPASSAGRAGTKPAARGKPKSAGKAAPPLKVESTVRVDTKRLDDIMNLVGELVLARNRLTSLRSSFEDESIVQAVANLDMVTADLQGAVMKTRMQPIKKVFGRFPRVVRDLARNLKKEINLELVGEETDLDKNLVEALADPLVHLVRNCVDHGIEAPEDRESAGKSRGGKVVLSAEQAGDSILLTITDDGAGMDSDKLRKMAVAKGFLDEESAARLSEKECFDLIFLPGSSTKQEISDVSGRGVGMDVVRTRIAQLNGTVDIESTLGEGTTLTIKVPLTLAILPTLMVELGQRKFALPLSVVNEIFELDSKPTNVVDGQLVVQNRGKAPPLFYLRDWLLSPAESSAPRCSSGQVIMVGVGKRVYGLVVDQVVGQEEVVIKPLGALLHGVAGLAGATITGDGNIALILDIPSLVRTKTSNR